MAMPLEVLLTGPFGNVGESTIRQVIQFNSQVEDSSFIRLTCFDLDSPVSRRVSNRLLKEFSNGQTPPFQVVHGNLLDEEQVRKVVQGKDVVIHLAAIIPPFAYTKHDLAYKVNVEATKSLVTICNEQPKVPRFVFASSYSVFQPHNPYKENPRIEPDFPYGPVDNYASHKVICEKYIVENYTKGPYCILRLGGVSVTLELLLKGPPESNRSVLRYSICYDQHRHAVHRGDVAAALVTAATLADESAIHAKKFLIGGDASWCISSSQMEQVVYDALGLGKVDPRLYRRSTKDEAFYFEEWMDTSEAQSVLNFQHHTLEDWKQELLLEAKQLPIVTRWGLRMAIPYLRWNERRKSRHFKYNVSGKEDPLADLPYGEVVKSPPHPY